MHALDEVFTDEEPADGEGQTGTHPFFNIWFICIIER